MADNYTIEQLTEWLDNDNPPPAPLTRRRVRELYESALSRERDQERQRADMDRLTSEELRQRPDDIAAVRELLRRAELRNHEDERRNQIILRTAEEAVLAACTLLIERGRYKDALSLQPHLQKLAALSDMLSTKTQAEPSGGHDQPHGPDEGATNREHLLLQSSGAAGVRQDSFVDRVAGPATARERGNRGSWCVALDSYRYSLTGLWLNIGICTAV